MRYERETVSSLPKGTAAVRHLQTMLRFQYKHQQLEFAEQHYADTPDVLKVLKAATEPMTTFGSGAPLFQSLIGREWISAIGAYSIVANLSGRMRRIPFNTRIARESSQSSGAQWIQEGMSGVIPIGNLVMNTVTAEPTKAEIIIPITKELVRSSSPAAESAIRESVAVNIANYIDAQFLDPTVNRSINKNPASITSGLTPITSSGTSDAQLEADMKIMRKRLTTARNRVWITNPPLADHLATKFGANGVSGLNAFGIPLVPTMNAGSQLTLVDLAGIAIADDGEMEIDASEQTALIMTTTPASSPVSAEAVALWQRDMVAFRAKRTIWWERNYDGAVAFMPVVF